MTRIPHSLRLILLSATWLLLLPSCMGWQLGERLRVPLTTYTGLDIERPADGKIYHKPTHAWAVSEICYVLAPEKNYNINAPLYKDTSGLSPEPEKEACNLRPTGRIVPVALLRDEKGNYQYSHNLPALPRGLVAEDADISPQLAQARENVRQAGNMQRPLPAEKGTDNAPVRTEPVLGRRVLIGCCDYMADPLLTLVSTPVLWAYDIVSAPFSLIGLIGEGMAED